MATTNHHTDDERKRAAWRKLEEMARQINPALPTDLSGQVLTICMSKDGVWAAARPASEGVIAG